MKYENRREVEKLCDRIKQNTDSIQTISKLLGRYTDNNDGYDISQNHKLYNTCVSGGPADGNENKSSADGPFAARNG
jgi:hypothetical protein